MPTLEKDGNKHFQANLLFFWLKFVNYFRTNLRRTHHNNATIIPLYSPIGTPSEPSSPTSTHTHTPKNSKSTLTHTQKKGCFHVCKLAILNHKYIAYLILVILPLSLYCLLLLPNLPRNKIKFNNAPHTQGDQITQLHGPIGLHTNGTQIFELKPYPLPLTDSNVNSTLELKNGGGFYLPLSDAIPLNREPPDSRDKLCLDEDYNIDLLSSLSATVLIIFYNEPLSTLLRSVHSILNRTPPQILSEIILFDDGSTYTFLQNNNYLDVYATYIPKTRVIHSSENLGIVNARLAAAKYVRSPVMVVLDSHIEVNHGWLEPLLKRLLQNNRGLVMPQIDSILGHEDFTFSTQRGIGCHIEFKYTIVERSFLSGAMTSTDPIKSPALAGGLFAMLHSTFMELGGYDDGFDGWGAENIEQAFRLWMCGGGVECVPCSRVYHIFRVGGVGYNVPQKKIWKNRLRTAAIWLDDYKILTLAFSPYDIHTYNGPRVGKIDKMMKLRKDLMCKPFNWFVSEISPNQNIDINEILMISDVQNLRFSNMCLDNLNSRKDFDIFPCHSQRGTQLFMLYKFNPQQTGYYFVHTQDIEMCANPEKKLESCKEISKNGYFEVEYDLETDAYTFEWHYTQNKTSVCMSMETIDYKNVVAFSECNNLDEQKWIYKKFNKTEYYEFFETLID